jgi:hypothetical protein
MVLANAQVCLFMQHCELFWDPSYTDFMKHKSVMNDSVGRTITNVATYLWNRTVSCVCSVMSTFVAVDRRLAPSSCIRLVLTLFLYFSSVPLLYWKSLMDCCPWYTFQPHTKKNLITEGCSFFMQSEAEWPWLTARQWWWNWPSRMKPVRK